MCVVVGRCVIAPARVNFGMRPAAEDAVRACRELESRFGAELRVLTIADRRPAHALVEAAAEADLLALGSSSDILRCRDFVDGPAWTRTRDGL